jgi:hypothetical protein
LTSYAVVNQYQCLEILKRPDVRLYHTDLPFFTNWRQIPGLLDPAQEEQIRRLEPPPPGLRADASLRIAHPTLVHPAARSVVVLGHHGVWHTREQPHRRSAARADALRTPGVVSSHHRGGRATGCCGAAPIPLPSRSCRADTTPHLLKPLDADTRLTSDGSSAGKAGSSS